MLRELILLKLSNINQEARIEENQESVVSFVDL